MDVNFCCFGALQENLDGGDLMKKVMKKIALICCLFLLTLSLISCDPYSGQRPYEQGDGTWVCNEVPIWFYCCEDVAQYPGDADAYGEVILNGEVLQIELLFVHQTNILFVNCLDNPEFEFDGECEFSPTQMVVIIDKNTDTMFNGQYDKIIFNKIK